MLRSPQRWSNAMSLIERETHTRPVPPHAVGIDMCCDSVFSSAVLERKLA
jgi:hypothetical protein